MADKKNNKRVGAYNIRHSQRRKRRSKSNVPQVLTAIIVILTVLAAGLSVFGFITGRLSPSIGPADDAGVSSAVNHESESAESDSAGETIPPAPEFDPYSYTESTLLVAGDIMYHQPQLNAAFNRATGEYDFTGTYRYIKDIVSAADYAVVNFEATMSGNEYYSYSGYPTFNAPDSAFTPLIDAGFDMMLFANNHCYDYGNHGLIRTQQVFDQYGMDYIGARKTTEDRSYMNVNVGGITVGMLNSTDDISYGNLAKRTINGITIRDGDLELMDIFNLSLLDEFYAVVEERIDTLRTEGAELIVYYIHWGTEYQLVHNDTQAAIAQKLCDLGVDVIIGGHPHVVQDAEMLTSTVDGAHQTLCFYSLGNVVSNQNRLTMGDLVNKAYTENGLMVRLTLRKYANGECMVSAVETIPLWVHRYNDPTTWVLKYDVLPIETALADPAAYGLYNSSFGVANCTAALEMTNGTLSGIVDAFAQTVILPVPEE
ncbi:MAG: CapA family protein [Clostridia bacterium]|nr:CapA family protein [Clostridia bacterium]